MVPLPDITPGAIGGLLILVIIFAFVLGVIFRLCGDKVIAYFFFFVVLVSVIGLVIVVMKIAGQG